MTDLLDQLKLRNVQKEDYIKVMEIRKNVYNGKDYLPTCFHQLVAAPNAKPFAAVLNDRFVAFTIAFIIDDGQTWVLRANRVVEDLEGKGIMTWLQGKVEEIVRNTTTVQYKVYTTIGTDQAAQRHIKQGKIYPVAKTEYIDFTCERRMITNGINSGKENVRILNSERVAEIFDSEDFANHLFRKQRLLIDYVPFRPIKSNLQYILHSDNVTVVGSRLDSIEHALLTFCHATPLRDGLIYMIDVYGNMEDLKTHILKHLEEGKNTKYGDEFIIGLTYDKDVTDVDICSKMEDISSSSRKAPIDGFICVENRIMRH